VAEDLFRWGICLPSSSNLTDEEQSRVIEAVRAEAQSARISKSSELACARSLN
jgi:pyridoxal phosphate-dependent aminotransferase EpsN